MTVEMRASDEDRQRVVAALQRHTAAGRLTLEEFTDRVGVALAARTLADLAAVLHDLPAEPADPPAPVADPGGRQFVVAFAVAIGVLVLLALIMLLH